ncbi:MAG: rod shape-determining protein MreC [bacterium JZ-2024 1]
MPSRRHSKHIASTTLFDQQSQETSLPPPDVTSPRRPRLPPLFREKKKSSLVRVHLLSSLLALFLFSFFIVFSFSWGKYLYLPVVQTIWKGVSLSKPSASALSLEREVTQLRLRISHLESEIQRNHEVLAFRKYYPQVFPQGGIFARILIRNPEEWFSRVIVDKGSKDGVHKNAGVLCPYGVLGIIRQTLPYQSTISLITDPSVYFGVMVQRKYVGVAKGNGKGIEIVFPEPSITVKVDELVETSGQDGIFPPFLPVGRVKSVFLDSRISALKAEVSVPFLFSRFHIVYLLPSPIQG